MKPKNAGDSLTIMTELVIPNDTNILGNLRGGRLLHWMDIASAISASKHSEKVVVTVSVDSVSFNAPINVGDVVTIKARVTRAFKTSMEVFIEVWAENLSTSSKGKQKKRKVKSNEAFFTFVALDEKSKPIKVAPVLPQTEEEKTLYKAALKRREMRLRFK